MQIPPKPNDDITRVSELSLPHRATGVHPLGRTYLFLDAIETADIGEGDTRGLRCLLDHFDPVWQELWREIETTRGDLSYSERLNQLTEDPRYNACRKAIDHAEHVRKEPREETLVAKNDDSPRGLYSPGVRRKIYSHTALMAMNFPPQEWVRPDLLPAGSLTALGGKMKAGKSLLALQMALAVAEGRDFFGRPTKKGSVLYYCLEDGQRRMYDRLKKFGVSSELSMDYKFNLNPLDGGQFGEVCSDIRQCQPLFVIMDTLAAAKTGKTDENKAGPMADLLNGLRRLAQNETVAILVVAHHGKGSHANAGDDLRGSSAIGAAADLILALYREGGRRCLKGMGRDVEPFELSLKLDPQSLIWSTDGGGGLISHLTSAQEDLLSTLEGHGETGVADLAKLVKKDRTTVQRQLGRLCELGHVARRRDPSGEGNRFLYGVEKALGDQRDKMHDAHSSDAGPVTLP